VKGQRDVLVRVTQKDRTWYVQEGPKRGKYRPFEAPFDLPSAYLFLMRSEPQFITEGSLAGLGKYEGTSNGISTFRTPLPDAQKKQLASGIAEFDRFRKENQGKVVEPEVIQSVDAAREVLSKGLSTSVELQSGMLTEFGAAEMRTKVSGFRWRSEIDPKEFATGGAAWTDYTDDPTASDLGDLLMIAHCGVWRPGMASPDSDGRLLNVTTGRYRRIPFQGAMTLPGCFTRDRTRVVVSGVDTANGVMGLYEIDLKSGKNRQLGGDLLATGFALFPSLSPDGKTVVVLHKDASGRVLEVQICLVDLATGTATPLGKPRDTGPVSWFPDGAALLINENKTVDVSKPSIGTICRMDMEGRITKLREGVSPVVLGDGKRILFEEQATRTWKTCDLSGGDEQVYASGMKGCAVPAPAPDGKRLLMMRFRSAQAPEPVVFPIGRSDGTPATTVPGLWKTPAWR
jgi:Tol biopolymer transport system component